MPELNVATVRGLSPGFQVTLDENSTLEMASDLRISGQSYIPLPSKTTANRPSNAVAGSLIYNTTKSRMEIWNGSAWVQI